MKLLKKSISVLIVCTMIFSLSAIITQSFGFDSVETQAAESDFIVTDDGAKYHLSYDGESLELIYLPESISGDYIVPSEVNGLKVTRISQDAFLYTNDIKSITIPETVTSCDFSYCQSLEKIIVDENNPKYSSDGFGVLYNKDKTELLFFPSNCKVKNYVLPASVEEIQTIESGVKVENFSVEDGNEFFSADENGILFNKDKTELVRYPSANKMTEYTVPSSVTKIGDHAFSCSENLKDIMIPLNVTSIDDCAFVHCIGLRKLTIPFDAAYYFHFGKCNCAKKISADGEYVVFEWGETDAEATDVSIGRNVDSLKCIEYYFDINYCPVGKIELEEGNESFSLVNGVLYDKNVETLYLFPDGAFGDTYVMPDTVVRINDSYSFNGFNKLGSITFGKSFDFFDGEFENYIEQYGEWYTYSYCIPDFLFLSPYLKEIKVSEDNPHLCSVDGVLYSKDKKAIIAFPRAKKIEEITVDTEYLNSSSITGNYNKISFGKNFSEIAYNGLKEYLLKTGRDEARAKVLFVEHFGRILMTSTFKEFSTDPNDKYLSVDGGVLYGFDKSVLIKYPIGNHQVFYHVPDSVKMLATGWINDTFTSPFSSIILDSVYSYRYTMKDNLTVHIGNNFGEISENGYGYLQFVGAERICTNNTESADLYNQQLEYVSYEYPLGIAEYYKTLIEEMYKYGEISKYVYDKVYNEVLLNNIIDFYEHCYSPVEICDGVHPEAELPTVTISISKMPVKTNYKYKMETLDLSGMEISVTYQDGTKETITATDDLTVTGFDNTKVGTQTVTVEYKDGKATFDVEVTYTWWQHIIRILLLGFLWY